MFYVIVKCEIIEAFFVGGPLIFRCAVFTASISLSII